MPKPAMILAVTMLPMVICRLNRHNRKLASPSMAKPSPTSNLRIDPAHQRADKEQRDKRADSARLTESPASKAV